MYLLRVIIPDRPGSLGAVASALGAAKADISAVEVVERGDGLVIDDFMLSLPVGSPPDALFTACAGLPGVEVMWVSFYPENWDLTADVDALDEMMAHPEAAQRILADAAPSVFHCAWALIVDRTTGAVVHRTPLAPELDRVPSAFGDVGVSRTELIRSDWAEGWGEQEIAIARYQDHHTIILGRTGPEFRRSELARLRHLAKLAGEHG